MKRALSILLLLALALAFGQTAPIAITKNNDTYTFMNVSRKTILMVVYDQHFASGAVTSGSIEFLFNARAFAPGDTHVHLSNSSFITVTFVQFSDGTTWGSSSCKSAQEAITKRKAILRYLPSLANAANETDFTAVLNQPQTDDNVSLIQTMYRMDVRASGVSVAWNAAKLRWRLAQSRSNRWNFTEQKGSN